MKYLVLILMQLTLISCSIGTSFKLSDIMSFKGTIIPELSKDPILIEKVSMDLIKRETEKESLNLQIGRAHV